MAKVNSNPMPTRNRPIVWTIAGSDSGGGAGIQADLATINDLDAHGCSVITAVTAQSSVTVASVEAVSPQILIAQLDVLTADLAPQAIKIGLLANQQQINLVANWLHKILLQWRERGLTVAVILDPVMVATCGDALTGSEALDFTPFKGLLTLITPNVTELATLAGRQLITPEQSVQAAQTLAAQLQVSVIAKGGDIGPNWDEGLARDLLVCHQVTGISSLHSEHAFWLTSNRINTNNNHGTGCTLSSAIAAVMAHGFVLNDAVVVAKAYVSQGLVQSYQPGSGPGCLARCGWPNTLSVYPFIQPLCEATAKTSSNNLNACGFMKLTTQLGVYPVVAELDMLQQLLKAGVKTIQLRVKDPADQLLEQKIVQAIAFGRDYRAQVFINDHWQLAIKHHAFGVHLGQEDLVASNLKQLSEANIALGLSSHSYFEILLAMQHKPSYIAFGHIFPTTTKQMPSAPQGLDKLARYVDLMQGELPLVAIGGIDSSTLAKVKKTGVDDIAVVRAVTEAVNPAAAYQALVKQWTEGE
ncbi:Phosphomethylpyrimidine kinase/thiamin-phosphate pyrophosphorylase, putative [Shewanella piezotolerans WP3]|uniref:Thiamine-phosphate synthase n=1 Tax=Shewanella piezotolerans (strain WP3 / JCM 13877) TaxID=225849 RepID=B8CNV7_SHEPW|nr:thiamine phosphate synthase [Shewanella piezotolerans]ACJ29076.1 Phosphomethylpyrimidine kinase/thiamin-phosphate pyrophosphorylase, putative [Shewanella piezotolerans WP3]